jgi:hypothetical protein
MENYKILILLNFLSTTRGSLYGYEATNWKKVIACAGITSL